MPKIMTSAVRDYSVAEVRRSLAELRAVWATGSTLDPFSVHDSNFKGVSFHDFCFLFVQGHHRKRHKKDTC
jgi:hypothetical protein